MVFLICLYSLAHKMNRHHDHGHHALLILFLFCLEKECLKIDSFLYGVFGGHGGGCLGQYCHFTTHLRRSWTRAFFQPTSQTVGFSPRLKKFWSSDNIFAALRFAKNLQIKLNTRKADSLASRDQYFGNRRSAKKCFHDVM